MKIYAIKGNREEVITEAQEREYLNAGYDIVKDGKRIISSSKMVAYSELIKLKNELAAEKEKVAKLEKKLKNKEADKTE